MNNLKNIETLVNKDNKIRRYSPHILVSGAIIGSILGTLSTNYFIKDAGYITNFLGFYSGFVSGVVTASNIIDEIQDTIKRRINVDK